MKKTFILFFLFLSSLVFAAEKNTYDFNWLDKDKEVYVLQHRKFFKENKFFVSLGLGKDIGESFLNVYSGKISLGYFFHENWGFDVTFSQNTGSENKWAKGVQEQGTVPFYRKLSRVITAKVLWSPFYSKINMFDKIIYTDWIMGLGVASIGDQNNVNYFTGSPNYSTSANELVNENNIGLTWGMGMRIYLSQHWSTRLDFNGYHYQAKIYSQDINTGSFLEDKTFFHKFDITFGANYTF